MRIPLLAIWIAAMLVLGAAQAAEPIRIAHVYGKSGPLASYAAQLHTGLRMGFEYATDGTMTVLGRPLEIIEKDTRLRSDRARALLAEAYGQDDVVLAVGDLSSSVALSMLPIAAEYRKILIPQGVADVITGEHWNRYLFRIGRSAAHDAVANAVAVSAPGTCIAAFAQDYPFGRDGIAMYKKAAEKHGARFVHEEYVESGSRELMTPMQRVFDALRETEDCEARVIYGIWAGAGDPFGELQKLELKQHDIKLSTNGNVLDALVDYKRFPGLQGATYYYYEHPDNAVNYWLVVEHFKRYNRPPDFFTAQGMAEAMAIVAALEKAGSTDTEALIEAFEGLRFRSPKGELYIRPEDHQALQPMYHFEVVVEDRIAWAVPKLVRVIEAQELEIPIASRR